MSQSQAIAEAQKLAEAIRARGVTVSIELQQGVSSAGWYDDRKVGVLAHHVVSRPSMGNTPFLSLVKKGRPDVVGPLCNGYMGFDRVYRIITMGWANHPGLGGPLTLAGKTIPRNNGRPYLWGTEFEGGLDVADWTAEYRLAMARAHAGVLDYLGLPVEAHGEHLTWAPGRKVDRLGYTTASGRAEVRAVKAPLQLTPSTPRRRKMLVRNVRNHEVFLVGEFSVPYIGSLEELHSWEAIYGKPTDLDAAQITQFQNRAGANLAALIAAVLLQSQKQVDETELAKQLAPQLTTSIIASLPKAGATVEQITAAVRNVLAEQRQTAPSA